MGQSTVCNSFVCMECVTAFHKADMHARVMFKIRLSSQEEASARVFELYEGSSMFKSQWRRFLYSVNSPLPIIFWCTKVQFVSKIKYTDFEWQRTHSRRA